ncbi:peptidoglycan recognition family protein [Selenomonas sp. F0473]|uniref:peptidoglycan recognition protein family protein n=1 Tax=Selenomonas sp. F0473 TaxID=999423 RepID=UPI00029E7F2E|nr:N-acetylmuramoyl-L-alanine amidase [Selenomonas sp. F0473]EKU70413.1 tat (twin-arginine translocation) pathway signal sequence [Selenomonas sp. F0473]
MNRRDFLRRLTLVGIGAAALPFFPSVAEASWYIPTVLPGVSIRPTHLKFGALENRFFTNSLVIHHIGSTNDDVSAETVHQWHLNNGWAGIGYHFLIRKDGTIEEGRPLGTVGAHVYGENRHTVGINIVGNFETAMPTEAQKTAAAHLIASLCTVYQFDPVWEQTIFGHRDLSATACPGRYLYTQLPEVVEQARAYYGSEELTAERARIAQREREDKERQLARARARMEEARRKNGARPSHPTPSVQKAPTPKPTPPPQPPQAKHPTPPTVKKPNMRSDIPKASNTKPAQRRIAN